MQVIKIRRGMNLPVAGEVRNREIADVESGEYALLAEDFQYLKPSVRVKEGDRVSAGATLLYDKNINNLPHVSPFGGVVESVMRGEKRAFLGIVLRKEDPALWRAINPADQNGIDSLGRGDIVTTLVQTGLWTSLTTRPFGTVADPSTEPSAVFITATDTRPLAPDVDDALYGREEFFRAGVRIVGRLTKGTAFLCVSPDGRIKEINERNIKTVGFSGPHPAGLAGTHVHFLHAVDRKRFVWEIGYQDVAAIGELFLTGIVNRRRVLSLAGEGVMKPCLVSADMGSNIYDLTKGKLKEGNYRLISGSVLYGGRVTGERRWLGRYHQQISTIAEGGESTLFSWMTPGFNLFSVKRIFMSHIFKPKKYNFTTSMHGSLRSMVPVTSYSRIVPLDILMTPFTRYLDSGDVERAEQLGALELLEEDLSLSTYASPAKVDFEPLLRHVLNEIRKEMF